MILSPLERERSVGAIRASVERLEDEKQRLIALDWTRESSRRVDVIDGDIAAMWDRLVALSSLSGASL